MRILQGFLDVVERDGNDFTDIGLERMGEESALSSGDRIFVFLVKWKGFGREKPCMLLISISEREIYAVNRQDQS